MIVLVRFANRSLWVTSLTWKGEPEVSAADGSRLTFIGWDDRRGLPLFTRERAASSRPPAGYRESHSAEAKCR